MPVLRLIPKHKQKERKDLEVEAGALSAFMHFGIPKMEKV
jgi:hypothetical protein